jgi:hypothetical protein
MDAFAKSPNLPFAIAAAVLAAGLAVHCVIGSRAVVRPLLAARDITPVSRWINFFTFHLATVVLAFMAAGFAWAALRPDASDIAVGLTALAIALALLCLGVCLRARFQPWKVPPFDLFVIVSVVGLWGLLA